MWFWACFAVWVSSWETGTISYQLFHPAHSRCSVTVSMNEWRLTWQCCNQWTGEGTKRIWTEMWGPLFLPSISIAPAHSKYSWTLVEQMNEWVNPAFTLVLVVIVESYLLQVVLEPAERLYYILGTSQSKEFHTMSTEYPCLQRNCSSVPSSCTTSINTTTEERKHTTRTRWVGGPAPPPRWREFLNKVGLHLLRFLPKKWKANPRKSDWHQVRTQWGQIGGSFLEEINVRFQGLM